MDEWGSFAQVGKKKKGKKAKGKPSKVARNVFVVDRTDWIIWWVQNLPVYD